MDNVTLDFREGYGLGVLHEREAQKAAREFVAEKSEQSKLTDEQVAMTAELIRKDTRYYMKKTKLTIEISRAGFVVEAPGSQNWPLGLWEFFKTPNELFDFLALLPEVRNHIWIKGRGEKDDTRMRWNMPLA